MKAMILAAGLGNRMRPLTDHTPKPLLPVGGKPLIVWQIERLRAAGFTELVINHAHLGQRLEEALGDGASLGVQIQWSREPEPLETAGGIATALPLLGEAPFLVTNGDVFVAFDYARLRPVLAGMTQREEGRGKREGCKSARRRRGNFYPSPFSLLPSPWDGPAAGMGTRLAHLVLVNNPPHHAQGDFVLHDGRVALPPTHAIGALTFSGIGCYHPSLFTGIAPGQKAPLAPLLKTAMQQGQVTGEHFTGRWEDVGTPERLAALDQELSEKEAACCI